MQAIQIGISTNLMKCIDAGLTRRPIEEILDRVYGHMQTFLILRSSGASNSEILAAVYKTFDNLMKVEREGRPISCRKGCAFCCRMNVDVAPMEVALILSYVGKKGISIDVDHLRAQVSVPKERLAFTPSISRCVFLQDDNTCAIYPVRPLACRKYAVVSPAEKCNGDNFPNAKLDVVVDIDVEILFSAIVNFQEVETDGLHILLWERLKPRS